MSRSIEKVKFKYYRLPIIEGGIITMSMFGDRHINLRLVEKLGEGSAGNVYLIGSTTTDPIVKQIFDNTKRYVIKISHQDGDFNLRYELEAMYSRFLKYNINSNYYPVYYGNFTEPGRFGIIFPYVGKYNLDTIFTSNLNISFTHNIIIIKQIIAQLKALTNIVHGDLKPCNIMLDTSNNVTIIDYGLMVDVKKDPKIISTNYITSPESLLTHIFKGYVNPDDNLDISKHDYYGLFFSVLNLFSTYNFYHIMFKYLKRYLKADSKFLVTQDAVYYYVYFWYKCFYSDIEALPKEYYKKMIVDIEEMYPEIKEYKYFSFDDFYTDIICIYLKPSKFNESKVSIFKDFLVKICHFDPDMRAPLTDLESHAFLQQQ